MTVAVLRELALLIAALAEAQEVVSLSMVWCGCDDLVAQPANRAFLIDHFRFRAIGPDHKEAVSGRVLQLDYHFCRRKSLLRPSVFQADAYMGDVMMTVVMGWLLLDADNPFSMHTILSARHRYSLIALLNQS
jgi:hypothetical protein